MLLQFLLSKASYVTIVPTCNHQSLSSAQPVKLDLDIDEDGNSEPKTAIMVENNKERSITLSPGGSYDIGCTSSTGFNNENVCFVGSVGTQSPVSKSVPASNNESAVFVFQPNINDNNKWVLRFQNFDNSMTDKYTCISSQLNKSLIINEGTLQC